jgi:hypothetical protein
MERRSSLAITHTVGSPLSITIPHCTRRIMMMEIVMMMMMMMMIVMMMMMRSR